MIDRLTDTLDFNAQALKLRGERQKAIASNIANIDTPNYKAVDFNFPQALAQAIKPEPQAPGAPRLLNAGMAVTNGRHMTLNGDLASNQSTLARMQYRSATQPSLDGNTVDVDLEQAKFADNTVRYEASLRFINGQIRTLTSAITGQG